MLLGGELVPLDLVSIGLTSFIVAIPVQNSCFKLDLRLSALILT